MFALNTRHPSLDRVR